MRLCALILLTAMGCSPTEIGVNDPDDVDGDSNTDVDDDTDADTDADTDPDTEPPPPTYRWSGEREFTFGALCRDTLTEEGVEVTDDDEYAEYREACDDCERLFQINVQQEEMCGIIPVTQEFVLGIEPQGSIGVRLVRFFNRGGRLRSYTRAEGQTRRGLIVYEYDGEYQGTDYVVNGFGEIVED